jgi:hypothetical protein
MATVPVSSRKPPAAPQWVFRWRAAKNPWFPKFTALVVAVALFTGLITMVRIPMTTFGKMASQKASFIYLDDEGPLALKARELGPFPSRFEPSAWQGFASLEQAALAAAKLPQVPYQPEMKDLLSEKRMPPLEFAARGKSFFPPRAPLTYEAVPTDELTLVPTLYPLAGEIDGFRPAELPPFQVAVTAAMASASWRFLVRLNSEGVVAECVSLERGGDEGALALEQWLRQVKFPADADQASRWLAVGVGFINQAANGTDAD